MVSEQGEASAFSLNMTFLNEPKLTIQSFHQCSSLIFIKLDSSNYLLWRSQEIIGSLGVHHHLTDTSKPQQLIKKDRNDKTETNPNYEWWVSNDGLLVTWLLGTMTVDVLSFAFGLEENRRTTSTSNQRETNFPYKHIDEFKERYDILGYFSETIQFSL